MKATPAMKERAQRADSYDEFVALEFVNITEDKSELDLEDWVAKRLPACRSAWRQVRNPEDLPPER